MPRNALFSGGVKSQNDDLNNQNHDVVKKFNETMAGLKEALTTQAGEIKAHGASSEKTAKLINELDEKLQKLGEHNQEIIQKHDELVKRLQRPGYSSSHPEEKAQAMTPGDVLILSQQYERMIMTGEKSCSPVNLGSTFREAQIMMEVAQGHKSTPAEFQKAIRTFRESKGLTSSDTSAGVLVRPLRLPNIVNKPFRVQHIRDLINVSPITVNSVEWIEETGFFNLQTKLTVAIAATNTTLTVENISGFTPGQTIRITDGTNTEVKIISAAGVARAASGDGGVITVTTAFANAYTVALAKVTSDLIAATPEGTKKPDGDITMTLRNSTIKTIAKGLPITRQIMEDAPRLRSYVDGRLMEGLMMNEDWHLLYGSGAGDELQGMMTHPNVQSYSWSAGEVGDTKYDALRRAMTKARLAEYACTGVILHPNDVEDLELIKSTTQGYMMVLADGQVWRVPYVETTAIEEGDFLTGNFQLAVELFDREQASVRMSEHHGDFFMRNMVQLLIEERLGLAYYRPEAMVVGSFDAAPAP